VRELQAKFDIVGISLRRKIKIGEDEPKLAVIIICKDVGIQ